MNLMVETVASPGSIFTETPDKFQSGGTILKPDLGTWDTFVGS